MHKRDIVILKIKPEIFNPFSISLNMDSPRITVEHFAYGENMSKAKPEEILEYDMRNILVSIFYPNILKKENQTEIIFEDTEGVTLDALVFPSNQNMETKMFLKYLYKHANIALERHQLV